MFKEIAVVEPEASCPMFWEWELTRHTDNFVKYPIFAKIALGQDN